jgi:uncharacterized protein
MSERRRGDAWTEEQQRPGPAASGLRSEATREDVAEKGPGPRERSERQHQRGKASPQAPKPSEPTSSVRLFVEAWDPSYGAGVESADFARGAAQSEATVDCDVEVPAPAWQPMSPPPDVRAPDVVLLVDGVRRIDARLWLGDESSVEPGLAASFAAGVVRCDLRRGVAEVATARVARGVFSPCATATEVVTSAARYPVVRTRSGDFPVLTGALQKHLAALEASVCAESRDESTADELLVADGPLRGRAGASRMLGYIKSQEKTYLPAALLAVVTALRAGQRSPVFLLGTRWRQYTWYLRLPGRDGAPWGNLVRIECSAELPVVSAVALADLSMVTLPRFAATSYKDPRAPQNLVPIAGLERRLRGMLGDGRLLHRSLTLAASQSAA